MKTFNEKGPKKWFGCFWFLNHSLRWLPVVAPRGFALHQYHINIHKDDETFHLNSFFDTCSFFAFYDQDIHVPHCVHPRTYDSILQTFIWFNLLACSCIIVTLNLTSHDLIIKIVQNLFIHNSYVLCIDIVHWKHIWHKFIGRWKICVKFVHSKVHISSINTFIHVWKWDLGILRDSWKFRTRL